MPLSKIAYVAGTALFLVLLMAGQYRLALALIVAGVAWSAWRIRQYIVEAREREARQWNQEFAPPSRKPSVRQPGRPPR
ncbi:hypothetical protein [Chitinimonas koreensis]|uniref:hypothetical protein n=1 Tax=Chitinimonas koreensis TaxID=356302 RepID=UPI0003F89960|nr:hypothetical protein [Chitinimonas koreensis]QNM96248.1 hypothetical protein H9L41_20970 [Chitinimonas koreensis]